VDCHPDRALIYSIIQGGVPAYQHAKSLGLDSEFFVSAEDRVIFEACEQVFLPKGKMPSISNIRQHYKIDIEEPTAEFDIDLCTQEILTRTLQARLSTGMGAIAEQVFKDPYEARDALGDLVKSTNWSLGAVVRTNSPNTIEEVKKRYLLAKSRDGGLLGYSSPWPSRDKASLGLQAGEVTVLLAKRKAGKCLDTNTLCHDPVTGVERTIEEIVKAGNGLIHTWDKSQPIHSVKPDAYVDTGTKECLKITWRSGRTLVATPEHPLMTPTGWQRLDELQEGHHSAAVALFPEPTNPISRDNDTLILLAYLIADGCCTKATPMLTNSNPDIRAEFTASVTALGCDVHLCDQGRDLSAVGRSGDANYVANVVREHGLMGKKSIHKAIPDAIFSLPNEQLALFIGRLWSCDGSVDARGNVNYSTGSRKLADQVQHLLLRFGVTSRIRVLPRKIKGGTETRDYYEVVVHRERIENFKRTVGREMIGPKGKKIQEVKFHGRSRIGWIRNEELWDQIREEMEARPELVSAVGEELGYEFRFQKSHVLDYKSGRIRKKVFEAFCDVYDSELKWVLDDDIAWDEIVMVESVGEKRVFDLTVIPTHCFIANDVIVHNTWILLKWAEHIWTARDEKGVSELGPGECILVVSMEMPVWQVLRRLFAIRKKLDYEKFRAGDLSDEEEERFLEWCEEMQTPDPDRPEIIVVASDRVRTVDDIVGIVAQYRPKVVFIDSFYILDVKNQRMQMWERMVYNIKAIKLDIAAQFSVPVLTTTQLSGQVKKGDMNAEADAVAYAKAIGDYADAIDGIFGNTEFQGNKRRIIRGMEAREFKTVDLEIHFDPGTHNYDEIKVLDKVEEGSGKSFDNTNDGTDDQGDDPFYDEDSILID